MFGQSFDHLTTDGGGHDCIVFAACLRVGGPVVFNDVGLALVDGFSVRYAVGFIPQQLGQMVNHQGLGFGVGVPAVPLASFFGLVLYVFFGIEVRVVVAELCPWLQLAQYRMTVVVTLDADQGRVIPLAHLIEHTGEYVRVWMAFKSSHLIPVFVCHFQPAIVPMLQPFRHVCTDGVEHTGLGLLPDQQIARGAFVFLELLFTGRLQAVSAQVVDMPEPVAVLFRRCRVIRVKAWSAGKEKRLLYVAGVFLPELVQAFQLVDFIAPPHQLFIGQCVLPLVPVWMVLNQLDQLDLVGGANKVCGSGCCVILLPVLGYKDQFILAPA